VDMIGMEVKGVIYNDKANDKIWEKQN